MPMPYKDIIFGPMATDLGSLPLVVGRESAVTVPLLQAENIRLTRGGYLPAKTMTVAQTSGAHFGYMYSAGSLGRFVNKTSLTTLAMYAYDGSSWTDVTPGAGITAALAWQYARFGDILLTVSLTNPPMYKDLTAALSTDWANVPDSPPQAQAIGVVRDHVVLGGLSGDLNAVRWGSIDTYDDWPTPGSAEALAEQAGIQYLPAELGEVIAIVGMEEFGIIVQQRGLTRMTYVGGDVVFQFDTYDRFRGRVTSAGSVILKNNLVYYYLYDQGFFATDGYQVIPLTSGNEETWRETSGTYQISSISSSGLGMDNTIAWVAGNLVVQYDVDTGSFSYLEEPSTISAAGQIATHYPTSGQGHQLWRVATNNSSQTGVYTYTDETPETWTARTGYIELSPGRYSSVQKVVPLAQAMNADPTVSVRSFEDYQNVAITDTGYTNMSAPSSRSIYHTERLNGRFHSFRVYGSGITFKRLQGVRVYYEEGSEL